MHTDKKARKYSHNLLQGNPTFGSWQANLYFLQMHL